MKRYFAALAVLCLCIVMIAGCTPSPSGLSTTTTITPSTTENNTTTTNFVEGIGGDGEWDFSRPYYFAFTVSDYVSNFVDKDDFDVWCNQFEHFENGGTRNKYEFNYYEFITEFSISREKMEEICAQYKELFPEIDLLTADQVDKLYTASEVEVYQYFANPYAVTVGKAAYSPKWMTEHTAEDYREAGITYDILAAKLDDLLTPCTTEQQAHIRTQCEALKD